MSPASEYAIFRHTLLRRTYVTSTALTCNEIALLFFAIRHYFTLFAVFDAASAFRCRRRRLRAAQFVAAAVYDITRYYCRLFFIASPFFRFC